MAAAATAPAQAYRSIDPTPAPQIAYPPAPSRRKRPLLLRLFGPLRPFIWRLILALIVVNLLLAGALYVQRGEIPGIISAGGAELRSGSSATVAVDGLNLRTDAGMASPSIGTLSAGQTVYLRGEPVLIDGARWWPVTVGNPSDGLDGYVWENGLVHGKRTIRDRIDIGIDNAIDRIREKVGV
jgi:hypothetical protein